MYGIQKLSGSEPVSKLPENLYGCQIALKMSGGVGDIIMSVGASAEILSRHGAIVHAIVPDRLIPLALELSGVSGAHSVQAFNDPGLRNRYDVAIDFAFTFNAPRELKAQEYYSLVEARLGHHVEMASFRGIQRYAIEHDTVCIHPAASNPNRMWNESLWKELAHELAHRGYSIRFLGTKHEFGFDGYRIEKIKEYDLPSQMQILAQSAYYLGCDSGFAHIAGVLGVPGLVLFGNTHKEHVIARYPKLVGLDKYSEAGPPTRSLRRGCVQSRKAMDSITVPDVLEQFNNLATGRP